MVSQRAAARNAEWHKSSSLDSVDNPECKGIAVKTYHVIITCERLLKNVDSKKIHPYQRLSTPALTRVDSPVHDELHVYTTRQAVGTFVKRVAYLLIGSSRIPEGQQATDEHGSVVLSNDNLGHRKDNGRTAG